MATIPIVPSVKDTTKLSLAQAIVTALSELNSTLSGVSSGGLINGSFEDVSGGEPVFWTITDAAGGSHVISDLTDSGGNAIHGKRSLQMLTTGGGGFVEALSDDFIPCGELNTIKLLGFVQRSVASIRTRIQILYFNESESLIATDNIYDNSGTGLTWAIWSDVGAVPAGAFFYKVKLIGGESGGAIAGNVFFDGFLSIISDYISVTGDYMLEEHQFGTELNGSYTKNGEIKVRFTGATTVRTKVKVDIDGTGFARIYVNGVAVGTEHSTASTSYVEFTDTIDVEPGDLVQMYLRQTGASGSGTNAAFVVCSADPITSGQHYLYSAYTAL